MAAGENMIPNVAVMLPRSTVERIGWYDPHILLKRMCDWDLWRRVAQAERVEFVDEVLATEHGVGLTGSLGRSSHNESALVLRYAATDRAARLQPSALGVDDGYRRDLGIAVDDGERRSLERLFLEHALATVDDARALEAAAQLTSGPDSDAVLKHFERQYGWLPETPAEQLVAAFAELAAERSRRAAIREIELESEVRKGLAIADERFALIRSLEQQLDETRHELAESQALAATLDSSVHASLRQLEEQRGATDHAERMYRAARKDADDARELLFAFRDAADHRLHLLQLATARLAELDATHGADPATATE
jgi:glycosyltransferase A (GT-A) superfamily protein (DUF2064 family)